MLSVGKIVALVIALGIARNVCEILILFVGHFELLAPSRLSGSQQRGGTIEPAPGAEHSLAGPVEVPRALRQPSPALPVKAPCKPSLLLSWSVSNLPVLVQLFIASLKELSTCQVLERAQR